MLAICVAQRQEVITIRGAALPQNLLRLRRPGCKQPGPPCGIILDRVFEETTLPDLLLAPLLTAAGQSTTRSTIRQSLPCEGRFDLSPTRCIVGVTARQQPDRMKMVRQEHNRRNLKRSILSSFENRRPKNRSPGIRRKNRTPLMRDNGEEERSTFFRSPIVAHEKSPLWSPRRRVRLDAPARGRNSNSDRKSMMVRQDAPYGTDYCNERIRLSGQIMCVATPSKCDSGTANDGRSSE